MHFLSKVHVCHVDNPIIIISYPSIAYIPAYIPLTHERFFFFFFARLLVVSCVWSIHPSYILFLLVVGFFDFSFAPSGSNSHMPYMASYQAHTAICFPCCTKMFTKLSKWRILVANSQERRIRGFIVFMFCFSILFIFKKSIYISLLFIKFVVCRFLKKHFFLS